MLWVPIKREKIVSRFMCGLSLFFCIPQPRVSKEVSYRDY